MNSSTTTSKPVRKLSGAPSGIMVSKKRSPGRPRKNGRKTSIYVTEEASRLWEATAAQMGVDKTAVLEMALREKAAKEGVK